MRTTHAAMAERAHTTVEQTACSVTPRLWWALMTTALRWDQQEHTVEPAYHCERTSPRSAKEDAVHLASCTSVCRGTDRRLRAAGVKQAMAAVISGEL